MVDGHSPSPISWTSWAGLAALLGTVLVTATTAMKRLRYSDGKLIITTTKFFLIAWAAFRELRRDRRPLDLAAASRVIVFDANWNPSHDLQAVYRAYRYGQTRPVFVYRLIAEGGGVADGGAPAAAPRPPRLPPRRARASSETIDRLPKHTKHVRSHLFQYPGN